MTTALSPSLFQFLAELKQNNRRDWFQQNKARYREEVETPSLALVEALAPRLAKISPQFPAVAKRTGGALRRIYRDTRFSKDKTPYKTHVGMQFPHASQRGPGFYLHLGVGGAMIGVGMWHPPTPALKQIRAWIDAHPDRWVAARDDAGFQARFSITGESLKSAPRGYPRDHALIEDLKRKDHIAGCDLTLGQARAADFVDQVEASFIAATPYVRTLCTALGLPF